MRSISTIARGKLRSPNCIGVNITFTKMLNRKIYIWATRSLRSRQTSSMLCMRTLSQSSHTIHSIPPQTHSAPAPTQALPIPYTSPVLCLCSWFDYITYLLTKTNHEFSLSQKDLDFLLSKIRGLCNSYGYI
jgi:hypothetical protein